MNLSDEEIQHNAEQDRPGNSPESKLYVRIFAALLKDNYTAAPGFAERIISRLEKQSSARPDLAWLVVGLFCFGLALIIAISKSNWTVNFEILSRISGYAGLIAFGLLWIGVLHYVDRRWIRKPNLP